MGVGTLYLSPVFDAASNHKYDTGDYEHVDVMFGGDAALIALFEQGTCTRHACDFGWRIQSHGQ